MTECDVIGWLFIVFFVCGGLAIMGGAFALLLCCLNDLRFPGNTLGRKL